MLADKNWQSQQRQQQTDQVGGNKTKLGRLNGVNWSESAHTKRELDETTRKIAANEIFHLAVVWHYGWSACYCSATTEIRFKLKQIK